MVLVRTNNTYIFTSLDLVSALFLVESDLAWLGVEVATAVSLILRSLWQED